MTSRERVLAALNHRSPDRTPRLLYGELIGYVPFIEKLLTERCAPQSPRDYFQMDLTGIAPAPTKLPRRRFTDWLDQTALDAGPHAVAGFSKAYHMTDGVPVDEWGVWWRPGSFHHFTHVESPLAQVTDFEVIKQYPWPDLDQPYRYQSVI